MSRVIASSITVLASLSAAVLASYADDGHTTHRPGHNSPPRGSGVTTTIGSDHGSGGGAGGDLHGSASGGGSATGGGSNSGGTGATAVDAGSSLPSGTDSGSANLCDFDALDPEAFTKALTRLKKNNAGLDGDLTQTTYGTHGVDRRFYLVIGPDGVQRGVTPSAVREDSDIYVIVYQSTDAGASIDLKSAGCDRLQTRVLGQAAVVKYSEEGKDKKKERPLQATIYSIGRCSADKQVSIDVKSQACGDKTVTFQTAPVYHLTIGYGAAYFSGTTTSVGVDVGAGGMPSTAYQHDDVQRGLQDRLLLGWFPLGYSPDTRVTESWRSFAEKLFLGTTVDVSHALSSVNLAVGLEPTSGFALFVGGQFCEKQRSLAGGLTDGSVYTDDSSKLPTTDRWECDVVPAPFVGVSVTADILAKLFTK